MSPQLLAALKTLDPNNADHWTSDGLPKVETLRLLSGDAALTRDRITAEAPGFTRSKAPFTEPEPATSAADRTGSQGSTEQPVIATPAAAQPVATVESSDGATTEADGRADDLDVESQQAGPAAQVPAAPTPAPVELTAQQLEEARKAKDQADAQFAKAVAAHDAAVAADPAGAEVPLAEQVQRYHATQLELAAARGRLRQQANAAGVNLKLLGEALAASPLDRSFARAGRGNKRPQIPLKR